MRSRNIIVVFIINSSILRAPTSTAHMEAQLRQNFSKCCSRPDSPCMYFVSRWATIALELRWYTLMRHNELCMPLARRPTDLWPVRNAKPNFKRARLLQNALSLQIYADGQQSLWNFGGTLLCVITSYVCHSHDGPPTYGLSGMLSQISRERAFCKMP